MTAFVLIMEVTYEILDMFNFGQFVTFLPFLWLKNLKTSVINKYFKKISSFDP